jgi:transposase
MATCESIMMPVSNRDEPRARAGTFDREWRRLQAWHLKQLGWKQRTIAIALGASEAAVSRWFAAARAGGLGKLRAKAQPGRPRRLTDDNCQKLEAILLEGPVAHGWANDLWTTARIARVIEREFGIRYHPGHVARILKERLNWTCQRPKHHHTDRNDTAIAQWLTEEFPVVAAAAAARKAFLVFIDETGFMLVPTVRRTFAPRGQTPVLRTGDPHGRISGIGAIVVSPGRGSIRLRYALLANQANFRGPSIVQFLQDLRAEFRGPMTIIWDRIPIHECAQVKGFLADHPGVVAELFPAYAPELNPADGIWRYVKYGRLANYTPYAMDELRSKVTDELNRLKRIPGLLKSFVRFTKLPLRL